MMDGFNGEKSGGLRPHYFILKIFFFTQFYFFFYYKEPLLNGKVLWMVLH